MLKSLSCQSPNINSMNEKIKVAIICHFSTAEVRERLPLDDRKLYKFLRKMLLMPAKGGGYGDIAPWDKGIIEALRMRDDIELYVISAHSGLKRRVCKFEMNEVKYWFVRCDVATMLKKLIPNSSLWLKLNPMIPAVRRIVDGIKPDIVNLQGNENSYYSSTVLGLKWYPIYSLCQTIYNNPNRGKYGQVDQTIAYVEREIFKKVRYFGVYCKMHYDLLHDVAPDVNVFKFGYPGSGKLLQPTPTDKEYDFVNFAMGISEKKGYYDAVKALAIVKRTHPDVKLNLVGGGSEEEMTKLKSLISELDLEDNIALTPFFEKRDDLFLHIQKSRFALLPCKMDNTSGTMTQSMQLGLPMVVYRTSGTPGFNKEKECALIAEHSNIEDLATKMIVLLDQPDKAEKLRKNAREFQERKAEIVKGNADRLVENYKAIIDNYRNGTPIPQEQLFNPEKDD